MQIGFYFDQSRCTGCYTCIIACKDWHDNMETEPENWIKVSAIEKGKFPDLSLSYLFITCLHCAEPPCIPACPVGAITKREKDGIVVVDREACLGNASCNTACQLACPYDTPQFGPEPDAKIEKCDLCLERWAEKKKPICVEACIMRALDAGPLDELTAKYGKTREAEGFVYSEKAIPSIVSKPKKSLTVGGRDIV